MPWNYRVMKKESKDCSGEASEWLELHEVYYDSKGNIEEYSENGICVGGSNLKELELDLLHMFEALKKPVLDADELAKNL